MSPDGVMNVTEAAEAPERDISARCFVRRAGLEGKKQELFSLKLGRVSQASLARLGTREALEDDQGGGRGR